MKRGNVKTVGVSILLFITVLWAKAQSVQSACHSHPISDEKTAELLQKYCGVFCYGDNNWAFLSPSPNFVEDSRDFLAPTGVNPGDAILVEVNDYWKSDDWANHSITLGMNLFDQVKYAVKDIHRVSNKNQIGSGMLYHIDVTTNRFFFALRRSALWTREGYSSMSSTPVSYNGETYYPRIECSAKDKSGAITAVPFSWYKEFSTGAEGWDALEPSYSDLQDGDFLEIPHYCTNTVIRNHFTTLYNKESVDSTYTASVFLYLPTGVDIETGRTSTPDPVPYIFFYINRLNGELSDKEVADEYNPKQADLVWKTSFEKAAEKGITFTDWASSTGGVREVSTIYRRIEGENGYTVVATDVLDIKTWSDMTLPNKADGYMVDYYVVTDVYEYGPAATRDDAERGEFVATATTNIAPMYIAGYNDDYAFNLIINSGHDCKFTPDANNIHQSTNSVTNEVNPLANDKTHEPEWFEGGDQFTIYRIEDGKDDTAIQTVTLTQRLGKELVPNTFETIYDETWGSTLPSQITLSDLYLTNLNGYGGKVVVTIYAKCNPKSKIKVTDGVTTKDIEREFDKNGKTQTYTLSYDAVANNGITITVPVGKNPPTISDVQITITAQKMEPDPTKDWEFKYRIGEGDEQSWKRSTLPTKQEFLSIVGSTLDPMNTVPGERHEARYKLVYTPNNPARGEQNSNTVECRGLRTDVKVANAYRSGTPDVARNATEELYSFDLQFAPIYGTEVASYYIWRNAEERVARIDQVGGGRFIRVYKDSEGLWNVTGEELFVNDEGMLNVHIDYASTDHVREGEFSDSESSSFNLFYTVEIETTRKATYGNFDMASGFVGDDLELVVNATAQFYKGEAAQTGNYRADLNWTKIKDNDNVSDELLRGYTVYRWMMTGQSGETANYQPINKFYTGAEDKATLNGFSLVGEEPEGTPYFFTPDVVNDPNFVLVDFISAPSWNNSYFPAAYYVTAHFENPVTANTFLKDDVTADQNVIEKNSNAILGSEIIITGVADVTANSPVVNETYYNLLGAKVATPEAGTVVIVEQRHANGQVTTFKKVF